MTRPDKLYAKLLSNPRAAISFRDFEKLLAAFGFENARTVGSHRYFETVLTGIPGPADETGNTCHLDLCRFHEG